MKIFKFNKKATLANQRMQQVGRHDKNNSNAENYRILNSLGWIWNATAGVFVKRNKK